MNTASYELLAASSDVLNVVAAFVGGLVIAGVLIWAVRLGISVRRKESDRPTLDHHGKLPESGAIHEMREMREPDEMPHASVENERLMPYELHHSGSKRRDDQKRRRWSPGNSGSFGGGGLGRT